MLEKRLLALPWIDLPDSLETLGNLAVQLQQLITAALSHPLLAVVVLLLGIGLIQLAADLVKRAIRASLTFILSLPLNLSQRLWKQITTSPDSKQTQIDQLLDRLDALRQEQDQVIAELKPLLSASTTFARSNRSLDSNLASESASEPASESAGEPASESASEPTSHPTPSPLPITSSSIS